MTSLLFAPLIGMQIWYAAPLIVTISLVYCATRHEQMQSIIVAALRFGGWIVGFMAILYLVLTLVSWGL